jgi:7,8-dihydropterin-6-yl-methyl-4-(beta-D-ribofuranosyl)aminobenzene 5'-phosphate synthase
LRYIRRLIDNRPVYAVIGGMHLIGASAERIKRMIDELRQIGIEHLAPAHCAGMPATEALWNVFPGRCEPCPRGNDI